MCGRGHAWWGDAWQEGVHGRGGMCGRGACVAGRMHGRGACMAGGHEWQGGMHGRGCAWWGEACIYYEIWSMSRQYASYWNAFLLDKNSKFIGGSGGDTSISVHFLFQIHAVCKKNIAKIIGWHPSLWVGAPNLGNLGPPLG